MTDKPMSATRRPITFERTYTAPVGDLWDLWTTKEGFEAWWGPQGFRVEVHEIDARIGGTLYYDMIAAGDAEIAYMKSAGMPLSHETRGTFTELVPNKRLKLTHLIDFVPGQAPYENNMLVEFFEEGASVRMVITVDPHQDDHWTEQATAGMESQLTKLPAVLAARAT